MAGWGIAQWMIDLVVALEYGGIRLTRSARE